MLDVDFEFFDPQPAVDSLGLQTLSRQLLDVDNPLFDVHNLVSLILNQPTIGSTVKVGGNETDPYAFLTVLNMHDHRAEPSIRDMADYILRRTDADPSLRPLRGLVDPASDARVGLVLAERLVNMPADVVPEMYRMLLEELQWAVEDKENYDFSHFLVWSRTYREVESLLDDEGDAPAKRARLDADGRPDKSLYFHPEDEILHRFAVGHASFDYTTARGEGAADSKRAFQDKGIEARLHLILMDKARFREAVDALVREIR
jgi:protein BCP1